MTRHDPLVRVHHMLDHAREALAMAENRAREDLDHDRQFNLALVRLMEIVGEAALLAVRRRTVLFHQGEPATRARFIRLSPATV